MSKKLYFHFETDSYNFCEIQSRAYKILQEDSFFITEIKIRLDIDETLKWIVTFVGEKQNENILNKAL